jgi:hypothetical protein
MGPGSPRGTMIYIASPYSHQLDSVRYERFIAARVYANNLMQQGVVCFSPIAYGRQFEKVFAVAPDHETWMDFNNWMLLAAQEVRVLKLPGWQKSRGVAHEIALANDHGIPVTFAEPI